MAQQKKKYKNTTSYYLIYKKVPYKIKVKLEANLKHGYTADSTESESEDKRF